MTNLENYLREAAAELRGRGMAEPKVIDTLVEVASDPTLDPEAPEVTLGTPREFASRYDKTGARSRGFVVISIGMGIALAIVLVQVVSSLILGRQTSLAWTVGIYSLALLIAVVSVVFGSRLDRRLPPSVLQILSQ